MKNKGKTKRLMWMTTAACAMMFLGIGVCLICGLRAARESIEESCKRDMEVVMEQLEKPYAMRLNTSDELTETMERYLFSQGRREIDLAADGRFLSALNGKSVRDVLFVTTDGHYVSVRGRTGWQKMDRENSGRLTAGKTVSGYRSWNGEEAFFVVKPIEPFFVQGEPYDAIALAYTPGSVNGALSFCAYGGQANVCIIKRDGRAVYAADDVWDQDDIFLRYAGAEKASAQADIRAGQAGCRTLEVKKERVYLAYRPIGDTPYMVVCEAACALVQNVMEDYAALIARIAALIGAMLAAVAALLDVSIRRMIDANHKAADARQSELAQEKANRELKSVNGASRIRSAGGKPARTGDERAGKKKPPDSQRQPRNPNAAQRRARADHADEHDEGRRGHEAVCPADSGAGSEGDGGAGGRPGGTQTCRFGRLRAADGGRRKTAGGRSRAAGGGRRIERGNHPEAADE